MVRYKEVELSPCQKQIESNEKLYQLYFYNLYMLKRILNESQKSYDKTEDIKLKEIIMKTTKQLKKRVKKLENKRLAITNRYEDMKRDLESLK